MNIAVLSDTHGKYWAMKKIFSTFKQFDYIIHLGDNVSDAKRLEKEVQQKVIFVKGNCDYSSDAPEEQEIFLKSNKILLTHGHHYGVKWGNERLQIWGEEKEADLVLFGHTHVPQIVYHNGILYMNPGSAAEPRGGHKPSFGIVQLDQDKILPHITYIP